MANKYTLWKQIFDGNSMPVAEWSRQVRFNQYTIDALVFSTGYWQVYHYQRGYTRVKWSASGYTADADEAVKAAEKALISRSQFLANYLQTLQVFAEEELAAYQHTLDAYFEREVYSRAR